MLHSKVFFCVKITELRENGRLFSFRLKNVLRQEELTLSFKASKGQVEAIKMQHFAHKA